MAFTKIAAAGIGSTETVTLHSLEVLNNATVGGVLTYEDVTNVDSIGIVTARAGVLVGSGITLSKDGDIFATGITTVSGNVKVGTGITLSKDGDVFFTGIATGNGSGLTALNASNISSGTVPTARLGSGTASSSTFLRGDSTFAAVTSTTINNNADNRLITGSGTANTLEGESSLTYSSTGDLTQTVTVDGKGIVLSAGNVKPMITGDSNRSAAGNTILGVSGKWNGTEVARIAVEAGADTSNKDDGTLNFSTTPSGGSLTKRMVIGSDGNITKPTQCSCAVKLSAHKSWPGDYAFTTDTGRLEFDTELWDIGSNFNTSNYTFTAPVAGRYLMNYLIQFESYTGFQWVYMYPVVNDSISDSNARGIAFADFGPGDGNSASASYWAYSHSLVANLQAGDDVKFKVRGSITSGTIKGGNETQWNIDLLA